MADTSQTRPSAGSNRRPPSRLQRRAPSSLQISPASDWKVAIPLLSPLATSPSSPKLIDRTAEVKPKEEPRQMKEGEKPVFKKWQHPAAPFCCEPAPFVRPFVPV
ncbi:hypothetical protein PVL29_006087 [Vitis rotundifolia]|uniref:Uncharacterized protein n=1 Tax=Vitis rotundifolia TaxID=103349 RepID=A0AA39A441_VITRO|nr:hypothetical protein PVL29_006087 [Vitis rotundifolia]